MMKRKKNNVEEIERVDNDVFLLRSSLFIVIKNPCKFYKFYVIKICLSFKHLVVLMHPKWHQGSKMGAKAPQWAPEHSFFFLALRLLKWSQGASLLHNYLIFFK